MRRLQHLLTEATSQKSNLYPSQGEKECAACLLMIKLHIKDTCSDCSICFCMLGFCLGPMVWVFHGRSLNYSICNVCYYISNSSQHLQPCCGQRWRHKCQSPIGFSSRSRRPHHGKKQNTNTEQKLIQARDMAEYGPTCATASRYQCFSLRKNCSWDSIAEDLVYIAVTCCNHEL